MNGRLFRPVKSVVLDVIGDGGGDEEVEGEALANAFTEVGGGDLDEGGVEDFEFKARGDGWAEVLGHYFEVFFDRIALVPRHKGLDPRRAPPHPAPTCALIRNHSGRFGRC